MTQFAIVGFGITTMFCPIARTYPAFVAIMVTLGLFDGMYVVLIAVVVTDIVGVNKLNQALGNLYGVISVAITVGPPFAGNIYKIIYTSACAFAIITSVCADSRLPPYSTAI
jgi:MCP family monocarboxylic acid transporter-like MFS transporter 10